MYYKREKQAIVHIKFIKQKSTGLFLPSWAAGIVGGGGGVGGSVGATVGFTTIRKIQWSIDLTYKRIVLCLPKSTYECAL